MNTTIKQLDKSTVRYIKKRLDNVLKPLAEELGVVIEIGNCTYQKSNCRFQLKVSIVDSDGKAITEEIESFRGNAQLFGFEPDDLGREFVFRKQQYVISGLNPKSRKYPVLARSDNGKDYKFTCRTVLEALGRKVPDWL